MGKVCSKCKKNKDLSCFSRLAKTKDGLHYQCKDCKHNTHRLYYSSNKVRLDANSIKWAKNNPEKVKGNSKKYMDKYYQDNKSIIIERYSEWQKNNRERVNVKNERYRQQNLKKVKDAAKKRSKKEVEIISDNYVKSVLILSGWERDGITPSLIGIKRILINHKRNIKSQLKT